MGKKDSAVIAARSALELDPSSGFAHAVIADALRWLDWAEAFERKTEHGPVFSEQIAELRQSAKQDNK
ncbi:MAG: hypothetical protein COS95_06325 [Ignavibacteriales bacterium CG07_land_8_20_14_0_80_59_12]|nr:MAG: hypothetical protein COS95_06325 [Ignavibacteriales bacterium CG07_land_8_20_14_0_80_59_12]